jgi:GNAT superfamily N-acetyltransferase
VTRPAVVVREATADDTPALLAMWSELRDMGGRIERLMPGPDAEGLRERLAWVATDPSSRALVAVVDDDEVAGMTLLTESPYAPLFEQRAVHAHYLHVRDGFRRRGVGKALLAAAVAFAEEVGAEHVMTSVLPQMRETQRFYARLGFSPVVVRRSAPVSVLRRRLAPSSATSVTDNLLARRRSLRRVRAAVVARVGD